MLKASRVRPASSEDCAHILRINAASRPAVAVLDRAELNRLLSLGDTHRVAVAGDGIPIGYLLGFERGCAYDGEEFRWFHARLKGAFLYVDQIAVDARRRRDGVGQALYAALLAHARSRQAQWLCCEVNIHPPNPVSLDFHRALGFSCIGNGDTLDGRRVAYLTRTVQGAPPQGIQE